MNRVSPSAPKTAVHRRQVPRRKNREPDDPDSRDDEGSVRTAGSEHALDHGFGEAVLDAVERLLARPDRVLDGGAAADGRPGRVKPGGIARAVDGGELVAERAVGVFDFGDFALHERGPFICRYLHVFGHRSIPQSSRNRKYVLCCGLGDLTPPQSCEVLTLEMSSWCAARSENTTLTFSRVATRAVL